MVAVRCSIERSSARFQLPNRSVNTSSYGRMYYFSVRVVERQTVTSVGKRMHKSVHLFVVSTRRMLNRCVCDPYKSLRPWLLEDDILAPRERTSFVERSTRKYTGTGHELISEFSNQASRFENCERSCIWEGMD